MSVYTTARSRRRFLRTAGATGATLAIAGCAGDGGSGDESGDGRSGDDDGSGDGGGDDGGTMDGGDNQEVTVGMALGGFQGMVADHILEDTSILEDEMNGRGYTANIQRSWEETALFAPGGPEFSMINVIEASKLASERDMELVSFARVAPEFMGWWVERGSEYDPAETGSAQATMDLVVENGANVGIGSWAGGHVPVDQIGISEEFGYDFTQEQGDFSVVTADYIALPELALDGELTVASTASVFGVALHLDENGDPQHREVFNGAALLDDLGIGVPPFNNLVTTQEFMDENEGAAEALLKAWHRGMTWLDEDPMGRVMEDQENHFEQIGVENEAQAQYVIDWGVNLSMDNEYPYNYVDVAYTDETLENERNFLDQVADRGFIPEDWADRLTHHQLPQE